MSSSRSDQLLEEAGSKAAQLGGVEEEALCGGAVELPRSADVLHISQDERELLPLYHFQSFTMI